MCEMVQTLQKRIKALAQGLSERGLHGAVIVDKVNQYYFTHTMQDAVLLITDTAQARLFVHRSKTRAAQQCPLPIVEAMPSYRALQGFFAQTARLGVEQEKMTLALWGRIGKYLPLKESRGIDDLILMLRSVKDDTELALLTEAAKRLHGVLENDVPALLTRGLCERAFGQGLFDALLKAGHEGLCRYGMFEVESLYGQIAFGTNALYPTSFNGPGGMKGYSAAVPFLGSETPLEKGMLVFCDPGLQYHGYHCDKTAVYSFGAAPSARALEAHEACVQVLLQVQKRMQPGALPCQIYEDVMGCLPRDVGEMFMGCEQPVKFLGHGVGLWIDEAPVLAKSCKTPLQENMVIAVEPKTFIKKEGMVGTEETFVITKQGAEPLYPSGKDIILVE